MSETQTIIDQHEWQAISVEPIEVLVDADGDPVPFTDPDIAPVTMYGCGTCDEPLDSFTVGTECKPS